MERQPGQGGPAGRASAARTRSARASSSRPTATSSPTTTSSSSADEITRRALRAAASSTAELVGRDPRTDIALLKVESDEPLPFVEFGDSDAAQVGDWVLAIGNPLGQGFSVSVGHRLGAQPHAAGQLRRLHPDRRRDQPRQLRRAAVQHERRGDRREHRDPVAERRLDRHRLRDVLGGGRARGRRSCRTSARPAAAGSACGSRTSTTTWPRRSASKAPQGALVTDVPEGPAAKAGMKSGDVIADVRRRADRRHPRARAHRRRDRGRQDGRRRGRSATATTETLTVEIGLLEEPTLAAAAGARRRAGRARRGDRARPDGDAAHRRAARGASASTPR